MLQAQRTQEQQYNTGTKVLHFDPGDLVLLLLPSHESELLAKWQGPFEVHHRVGPVDYKIRLSGQRKEVHMYHMHLLKAWKDREALFIAPLPPELELGPLVGEPLQPWPVLMGEDLSPTQ